MEGISNITVVNFLLKKLILKKKKFVGVFPSNYVIRFINLHSMMIESKSSFTFIIMNTD